jgi:cytochrome P450
MASAAGGVLDGSVEPIGAPVSDLDPYSIEFLTDPFPFLSALRDVGPVVFLERYGVWAVARHEWVERVLRDYETFSSAAGAGMANLKREEAWRQPSNILEVDPPLHTTNRRILNRALAPPSLRSLQEQFDRRAQRLADDLAARGRFDAITDLAEVFPTQVFPEAFGLREDGKDKLLAYASMVFNGTIKKGRPVETSSTG